MLWKVKKSIPRGRLSIPPSKSHTIRGLLIATCASGESVIATPLLEGDGKSALDAVRSMGANYDIDQGIVKISGIANDFSRGQDTLYMGNSGAGTRMFTSLAALSSKERTFDGDTSLRSRPMKPLLQSLSDLGAKYKIKQKTRDIPFVISGPLIGGETTISGITSQYLSSLLLTAPLISGDTIIHVKDLHERPYVEITLWWLKKMNIRFETDNDFSTFFIKGNQSYTPIHEQIPGDFSSATFGAVAAALTGGPIILDNIDFSDPQGDKEIFSLLEDMGVTVVKEKNSAIVSKQNALAAREIDLNKMPDALPAFAVLACAAEGISRIVNVKQARIKESDRITVMTAELTKMGARVEEQSEGMVIHPSKLEGCRVNGHHDHRVVMALALAAMTAEGETTIETAECADVTYPGFVEDFRNINADIEIIE